MLIKSLHVSCAYATGLSFLLRAILAFCYPSILEHRWLKIVPHVLDTVLLASAFTMLFMWSLSPLSTPWLLAKILALFLYIAFGLVTLRFGTSTYRRLTGFIGGVTTYLYIVTVAHTKTPLPWMMLG